MPSVHNQSTRCLYPPRTAHPLSLGITIDHLLVIKLSFLLIVLQGRRSPHHRVNKYEWGASGKTIWFTKLKLHHALWPRGGVLWICHSNCSVYVARFISSWFWHSFTIITIPWLRKIHMLCRSTWKDSFKRPRVNSAPYPTVTPFRAGREWRCQFLGDQPQGTKL